MMQVMYGIRQVKEGPISSASLTYRGGEGDLEVLFSSPLLRGLQLPKQAKFCCPYFSQTTPECIESAMTSSSAIFCPSTAVY